MPRVIAVANQKGGVGKTTTAVNLAASLAEAGERVLLVDCDPQGNATSSVGVRLKPNEASVYHFLMQDGTPPPVHRPLTPALEIDLLPSNATLAAAEWEFFTRPQPELLLQQRLAPLIENYSFVLLDAPPSLGFLTVNCLSAARSVLIPLQCEYFAMEGLSMLLETIRKIRLRFNPHLAIEGIVLTMFDRRNNLAHQVANEINSHLQFKVFKTFIPRNVRLSESPSYGLPAILYDQNCAGTKAYLALAQEILAQGAS